MTRKEAVWIQTGLIIATIFVVIFVFGSKLNDGTSRVQPATPAVPVTVTTTEEHP